MKTSLLSIAAIALVGGLATTFSPAAPAGPISPIGPSPTAPSTSTAFHCQVPCGIYGDKMRMDMLMEQSATIEKAMTLIQEIEGQEGLNRNQLVRWVMTKEEHAAEIQETVASYWLAQRIKMPKDADDTAAMAKYHGQLELLHGITVAAMKCKQTVESSHVGRMRDLAREFSGTYFSADDMKHLKEHTFGE